MSMLRAGVIGTGSMGKNHVRVYAELPNVELVCIADPQSDLSFFEKKYKAKTYTDYKKMLDEEELDLVTVATPTITHKDVALDVMGRGIHLLLEKPIADSAEEADEIIAAAEKNGVKLMVGHLERFNPAVIELKRRIQEGELGKVYKVDVNRVGPIPPRIQDVGVTIDLAVHDIDVMRFLTEAEPERVFAETEQRIHSKREDLLAGIIRFTNRTICYLNVNWLTATRIRKLYITGEKGMFVIDYIQQTLHFFENAASNGPNAQYNMIKEGKMIRYPIHKKEPLKEEIAHFVECIEKDTQPLVSGEDGKKAIKIALDILTSAKTQEVVKNETY